MFRKEAFETVDIRTIVSQCLCGFVEELFAVNYAEDDALRDLEGIIDPAIEWAYSAFQHRYLEVITSTMNDRMPVDSILAVEEVVWSPILGLKGQMDIIARSSPQGAPARFIPVELKTGKFHQNSIIGHRAQVFRCRLLLSMRI